ncbi:MAG: UDP-glucose/GDP-mannose dehydrogenase family protein, partial [Mariniphaga sp.]|nr:UDP-glucose/GDP-mannose dehydrogenase family protein [Mariniphaga sp.]
GGSCFPKDVQALIRTADEQGYSLEILKAVENVNYRQKSILIDKINKHFNGNLKGKKFAIWGLSFKPKTDDMREAPSLVVIDKLRKAGAEIIAYDPVAMDEGKRILDKTITFAKDEYDACIDADALIIITEWPEFRIPNFRVLEKLLINKVIFDGRNIYDPDEMNELKFTYYSIGRKSIINS